MKVLFGREQISADLSCDHLAAHLPGWEIAMESGQVGGAGLDVFSREPADPQSPLVQHPNVIATPHIGWHTGFMFAQTSEAFAANLMRYSRGEPPLWTVNSVSVHRA